MAGRNFGMAVMMMGSALILSGGMAFAEDEAPLPPVRRVCGDKHSRWR